MRKGQITIFILFGIVLLIIFLFLNSLNPEPLQSINLNEDISDTSFVETCIDSVLEKSIQKIGFLNLFTLENYVNFMLEPCSRKYELTTGVNTSLKTKLSFSDDNLTLLADVYFPRLIVSGNVQINLDYFKRSYFLYSSQKIDNSLIGTDQFYSIPSSDLDLSIFIPEGIIATKADGTELDEVSILLKPREELHSFYGNLLTANFYEVKPFGTNFSEPIKVIFNYDETLLPEGIDESQLRISIYDSKGLWVPLDTTIDSINNNLQIETNNLSNYVITYLDKPEIIYDNTYFIKSTYFGEFKTNLKLNNFVQFVGDFNGDSIIDFASYSPPGVFSTGGCPNTLGTLYRNLSESVLVIKNCLGKSEEILVPGNFNGDLFTDLASYDYTTGIWEINDSSGSLRYDSIYDSPLTTLSHNFGEIPVPADFDGDGLDDLATYSGGTWIIRFSSNNTVSSYQFGSVESPPPLFHDYTRTGVITSRDIGGANKFGWYDLLPVPADYDGDGKADLATYYNGIWSIKSLNGTEFIISYGLDFSKDPSRMIPIPSHYDNDGILDLGLLYQTEPDIMGKWRVKDSNGLIFSFIFGSNNSYAVPGDYDNNGVDDFAVYYPEDSEWFILTDQGRFSTMVFGDGESLPASIDLSGSNIDRVATYDSGLWKIKTPSRTLEYNFGGGGIPVPGDYDGDGRDNLAVYNINSELLSFRSASGSLREIPFSVNNSIMIPMDLDGDNVDNPWVYNYKDEDNCVNSRGGIRAGWYSSNSRLNTCFGGSNNFQSPISMDLTGIGKDGFGTYHSNFSYGYTQRGSKIVSIGPEEDLGAIGYYDIAIAMDSNDDPHVISAPPVHLLNRVNGVWYSKNGDDLGIVSYASGMADISIGLNDRAWYSGSYIQCAGCDAGNWMASVDNISMVVDPVFSNYVENTFRGTWDTGFVSDSDMDLNNSDEMFLWSGARVLSYNSTGGRTWRPDIFTAGHGGEKNAFKISERDNQEGIFHTAIGGCTGKCGCAKYANSLLTAPVCWFDSLAYPQGQVDAERTYIGLGTDSEEPEVAYLSAPLNGLSLNIWDGSNMLFPIDGLYNLDSCVNGVSANGAGTWGRIEQGWTPVDGGGAFICWTHCDNHIYLKYVTPKGVNYFGPDIDLGPGSQCAMTTDSEGDIHMVYNNGGIKYRKIITN